MAQLTPARRAALPSRMFGLPERARTAAAKRQTGNYPIPDRGHAISAKRLADKQLQDGKLTRSQFDRIVRKANAMLRRTSAS